MRWTQSAERIWRATSGIFADGEVVWSWRADAGARLRGYDPRGDGGKTPVPRESAT
jgi:hypothetical protein